jgi:hypothetical protein
MYCTPNDVARECGKPENYFTTTTKPTFAQVERMIVKAQGQVDAFTAQTWGIKQITELHDAFADGVVALKHGPVISVDTVKYWDGNLKVFVDAVEGKNVNNTQDQYYEVYAEDQRVEFYTLKLSGRKMYEVTYTYGYKPTPQHIADLTAMVAAVNALLANMGPSVTAFNLGDAAQKYSDKGVYGVQIDTLISQIEQAKLNYRKPLAGCG